MRIKKLLIDPQFLVEWWKGVDGSPMYLTQEGLPSDARVVACLLQESIQSEVGPRIALIIESETFEGVKDARFDEFAHTSVSAIPELKVTFNRAHATS